MEKLSYRAEENCKVLLREQLLLAFTKQRVEDSVVTFKLPHLCGKPFPLPYTSSWEMRTLTLPEYNYLQRLTSLTTGIVNLLKVDTLTLKDGSLSKICKCPSCVACFKQDREMPPILVSKRFESLKEERTSLARLIQVACHIHVTYCLWLFSTFGHYLTTCFLVRSNPQRAFIKRKTLW